MRWQCAGSASGRAPGVHTKPTSVFKYLDYREFLRDRYRERKQENASFSYRLMAARTGLSAGFLMRVFKGEKNLHPAKAADLASLFGLGASERDYFETLVLFGQAKTGPEKDYLKEKILRIRSIQVRTLGQAQADYFRTWYFPALREILNFFPFDGDYATLARMIRPPIRPREARKAVDYLLEAGLVVKGKDGVYRLPDMLVSSGEKVSATLMNDLHHALGHLALRAIREMEPKERDFSFVTISLSSPSLEAVKAKIRKFRKEILDVAGQDENVNGAYHMNIQLFPVSYRQDPEAA